MKEECPDWRDLWDMVREDLTDIYGRRIYVINRAVDQNLFEQLTEYNGFLTEC